MKVKQCLKSLNTQQSLAHSSTPVNQWRIDQNLIKNNLTFTDAVKCQLTRGKHDRIKQSHICFTAYVN